MNRELLLDAVGHLDVGLIEKCLAYEAAVSSIPKRNWNAVFRRVAVVAACLCIAFIGVLHMQKNFSPQEAGPIMTENGVYIPPVPETRKNDGQDHMTALPMVSYNGQIYIMDEVRDDNGMVGEELGEGIYVSYEMLNEYTFTEELVFYNNSSYKPKIYEVEGYSYEFLICEKLENEQICVYIRHSDMTVKYGKDLFGDYMHLKENLKEESFFGENKDANSVEMIAITDFFDALYEGEFIVCKRNDNTFDSVITSQKYILSFPMQNDINFSVVLSSAGYAWWYLHWEDDALVCVPIDEEVCQRVIKTVEKCYE